MAAYVALLADQFESLSYPLAPWIQRPPSTFSYEQSCRRIGWAALEREGILIGCRIKQAVGAWRSRMGRKVLVVDDEPLVLDVVATMLEELGCDVETAHTGADALNRLGSEEHIDILLADINMPGLDGRKLAYRAKQRRPELYSYQDVKMTGTVSRSFASRFWSPILSGSCRKRRGCADHCWLCA